NEKNFDEFIVKGNSLVDFWAEWCAPCKILMPVFNEVARDMKGKVKFGKLNIEDAQEIADRFMVVSVPTVVFFKDGEMIDRFSGLLDKKEIIKMIKDTF
ncbi:MAG: thioredoxin, partial [Candidatus Omnitrophica bacterium]|nr:thioredoxin [Candidatus Omnitrophota bacterium]